MSEEKEKQPGKVQITQTLHRELFRLIMADAKRKGVSLQTIITLKLNEAYGIN